MIIVFRDLLIGHTSKVRQFDELGRGKYPFGSNAALAMKNLKHFLYNIELLHFLALYV